MSKDQVSRSYMEEQKALHASKPLRNFRQALIIGSEEGNIGGEILDNLWYGGYNSQGVSKLEIDVTAPTLYDQMEKWGGFESDILILANGYTNLNWFEDVSFEDIEEMFAVNAIGSIKAANLFVKNTINKPYKKYIVFIGSMAYARVLNGSSIYCAAKAALAHATRCLAWELAPKGFNVFCVHPSNTEGTPMTEKTITDLMRYRNLSREEAEAYWGAVLPKDKWLQPENIADVVSFLVSGKADYMSGANVELSGGQR